MAVSSSVFTSTWQKKKYKTEAGIRRTLTVLDSIGQIRKAHHSDNKLIQQYNTSIEVTILLLTTRVLILDDEVWGLNVF